MRRYDLIWMLVWAHEFTWDGVIRESKKGGITDLSPLFNWNTKQLFVYVFAAYSSSDNPSSSLNPYSESIIWDKIVEPPRVAVLV